MTINVCFHGIGVPRRTTEPGEDPYWITANLFFAVLDLVVGRDDVAISFDDGNQSDLEIGLPALLERGLRATFFPVAGRLEQDGSLSADDLQVLRGHGMIIGSHGMRHVPWRGLTPAEQHDEFVSARLVLQEASKGPVSRAALPLGRYDRSVLTTLRALGYDCVYSSDRHPARSGTQWLRPRYSIRAMDDVASVTDILRGPRWVEKLRTQTKITLKSVRPGLAPTPH